MSADVITGMPALTTSRASNPRHASPPFTFHESAEPTVSVEDIVAALPVLLASDSIGDRVRARMYVADLASRILLPAGTWCVVEPPESPNRARRSPLRDVGMVWSAHDTAEDAERWRASFQANSDALIAKHGWGEDAHRVFVVVQRDDATAGSYVRPDVDPAVANFAFKQ